MRFPCTHILWLTPILALAGCGPVTPTSETVTNVAVELVERGLSVETGLRDLSSDQPVDPAVNPSGQDLKLGVVVKVPLTGAPPRDPPPERQRMLEAARKKLEETGIARLIPKYRPPPPPMLQLDPLRRMVRARKHRLRTLAVEVVRSEPLFWLEDGAGDGLIVQIQLTEPEILTEPGGALRWSAGRHAITLDLVGESIAAEEPSPDSRYGVLGATLTASDRFGKPERELLILVNRLVVQDHVRDGDSLRPLPTLVFHGPTVLAGTRR